MSKIFLIVIIHTRVSYFTTCRSDSSFEVGLFLKFSCSKRAPIFVTEPHLILGSKNTINATTQGCGTGIDNWGNAGIFYLIALCFV